MATRNVALLAVLFAFACGKDYAADSADAAGGPDELLAGFNLPAPPTNGMRIITPPVRGLEPGSSHEICAWTGIQVDHDIDIRKADGYQLIAGHHIILFASKLNLPAGTERECTDTDMASFRMVVATGAEGLPSEAPGDLVYRVDAGMYLVLQEHYINSGDATVDSQSALDVTFADPGMTYTPSHSIAFLNSDLDLKPGLDSLDVHCQMTQDMKGWYAIPHMHEWGTNFNATITHAGVVSPMFDNLVWNKDYMFSPPAKMWDVTAPTMLYSGDQVDVHCDWDNTTSSDLHFGTEMCVFYVQMIDDANIGNLACDNGGWGPF